MERINRNILLNYPSARAMLLGSDEYPKLRGTVSFYEAPQGTVVVAEMFDLPGDGGVFAMHIHEGGRCSGNSEDPFADVGMHYDIADNQHPFHVGDLPPVFNNGSYAWSASYTSRFRPQDVVGRTVILHSMPDDFRTQPSGNSGKKIACGQIVSA